MSTIGALGQNHTFTVSDDIGMTHLGCPHTGGTEPITLSPDHRFVAIYGERGSVSDDILEDQLRIYDVNQLRQFVNDSQEVDVPSPLWTIHEATNKDGNNGCLMSRIRWSSNSRDIAFVLRNQTGHAQLLLANLDRRKTFSLSPANRNVTGFEIRDREHYAFTLASAYSQEGAGQGEPPASVVKPGQAGLQVAFSDEVQRNGDRSELWVGKNGISAPLVDPKTGRRIILYWEGAANLALSPDGMSLVTALPVEDIPKAWEQQFPPPYPEFGTPIKAGRQDLTVSIGTFYVSEYASISLKSGIVIPLFDAPTAERAGWWANFASPAWSDDSSAMILPGAFPPDQDGPSRRPCVVVRYMSSPKSLECVLPLKRDLANGMEAGYERIMNVTFASGTDSEIIITYRHMGPGSHDAGLRFKTFLRVAPQRWTLKSDDSKESSTAGVVLEVNMSFKDPPTVVATDTASGRSRVIWDPNPQFRNFDLSEPIPYQWKDNAGLEWNAILYKPSGYVTGKRYPLVIETHGFDESIFDPSGGFPTAFAARELASAGIMVLHIRDCPGRDSAMEGPCNVRGYESGVAQLTKEGMIDPSRVGITGFSRTVIYVMEALTTSNLHFAAASITDGVNLGYLQHILHDGATAWTNQDYSMIGSPPIGAGLSNWIMHSPEFNLDKVSTPLRIVSRKDGSSILYMWEPYALLREMNKPVEFVVLNTTEHVLTNPAVRLAAQGGNLDWYRFWLQGYEDKDPLKQDQYRRWEAMRNNKLAVFDAK